MTPGTMILTHTLSTLAAEQGFDLTEFAQAELRVARMEKDLLEWVRSTRLVKGIVREGQ